MKNSERNTGMTRDRPNVFEFGKLITELEEYLQVYDSREYLNIPLVASDVIEAARRLLVSSRKEVVGE